MMASTLRTRVELGTVPFTTGISAGSSNTLVAMGWSSPKEAGAGGACSNAEGVGGASQMSGTGAGAGSGSGVRTGSGTGTGSGAGAGAGISHALPVSNRVAREVSSNAEGGVGDERGREAGTGSEDAKDGGLEDGKLKEGKAGKEGLGG